MAKKTKKAEDKKSPKKAVQNPNTLRFIKCNSDDELKKLYNYDVDVFAEAGDFDWSLENLKKEKKQGWEIYSVEQNNEIIAAVFLRFDEDSLATKNTSIKMTFQGQGFSHRIKDFYEHLARAHKVSSIVHYCAVDNFRAIALNESHGYKRVKTLKNGEVIEWKKTLAPLTVVGSTK
jgi:RimJ/RimL family protein N-acetyltransferase